MKMMTTFLSSSIFPLLVLLCMVIRQHDNDVVVSAAKTTTTTTTTTTNKSNYFIKINNEVAIEIISNDIIRIFHCCNNNNNNNNTHEIDHYCACYNNDIIDVMKKRSSLVRVFDNNNNNNDDDDDDDVKYDSYIKTCDNDDEEGDDDMVVVSTDNILIMASITTGHIEFYQKKNDMDDDNDEHDDDQIIPLLKEGESKFELNNNNKNSSAVTQDFLLQYSSNEEGIYGGGQYVNGFINYRSAPISMKQYNTEAVVPFFVSSKSYGIVWDLYGETMLNQPQIEIILNEHFQGRFIPPNNGDYWFYLVACQDKSWFCNGNVNLTITTAEDSSEEEDEDDNVSSSSRRRRIVVVVCEHSLANMPHSMACRVQGLIKDKSYKIHLDGNHDDRKLFVTNIKTHNKLTFQTQANNVVDYYFIVSPKKKKKQAAVADGADDVASTTTTTTTSLDGVIYNYRKLTGTAYLYDKWVYGFWQCKEHYHNQTELLDAAMQFRKLQIPIDAIVQDWHYWGDLGWGPQWDTKIYPNPKLMIDTLHSQNIHFMVSVWSKFDKQTKFYKAMKNANALIDSNTSTYMDIWNPKAQQLFYRFVQQSHFDIGVDALWLDATEPEFSDQLQHQIYLGSGDEYANTYSLMVTKTIYDGSRNNYPNRRIFSLTRSSFTGQQRYGGTLWSGDTTGSWDSLRRQIAMSINYQLSGIPYWSMDIGGFFRPKDQYTNVDYHHLLIRWFQFAVFTPIFRVHGSHSNTELWNYPKNVQATIVNTSIRFRYRLLEYIYSGYWKVETQHYTMQRGLIMDFADTDNFDNVVNIADQFMFGQSFLVAPIYQSDSTRSIYLPKLRQNGKWRCFYSGNELAAGEVVKFVNLTHTRIPLFVRSSIVVLGPDGRQHVNDDNNASSFSSRTRSGSRNNNNKKNMEIRVYDGSDSKFELFDDDGISNNPNRPTTIIAFSWNDSSRTLSISGLITPPSRRITMDVVLVRPGVGIGIDPVEQPDLTLTYNGTTVIVHLPSSSETTSTPKMLSSEEESIEGEIM